MNKLQYALGMLATGAVAGFAGNAAASTTGGGGVFVFTPPDDEITADHTQPFEYDVLASSFGGNGDTIFSYHGDGHTNHLTTGTKSVFGADLAHFNSQVFATGVLPSSSETFDQTDITTWTSAPAADPWYHVEFTVPAPFNPFGPPSLPGPGRTYLGAIQINANGNQELDQMIYTPLSVPEPEVWALMILGLGASGAALRRRRTLAA